MCGQRQLEPDRILQSFDSLRNRFRGRIDDGTAVRDFDHHVQNLAHRKLVWSAIVFQSNNPPPVVRRRLLTRKAPQACQSPRHS